MRQSSWSRAAILSLGLIGFVPGAPSAARTAEDSAWKAKVASWVRADLTFQPGLQGSGAVSGLDTRILALVPTEEGGGLEIDGARLRSLGCDILRQTKDIVLARVPLCVLSRVIEDPAVGFVRPPFRPTLHKENARRAIGAAPWHEASHDASGVKVGLIDVEFQGYRDLFRQIRLTDYATWAAPGVVFGEGEGPHGAACTEVLHAIAPGAELYLAQTGSDSFEADFPAAVGWLLGKDVSVVSMSLGMMAFYYDDGSSPLCNLVDEARSAGVVFCVAAGNEGESFYWTGDFVDADGDGFLEFSGTDAGNDFEVGQFTAGALILTWDGGQRTAEDFDLLVRSKQTAQVAASSAVRQEGAQPALEIIYFASVLLQPVIPDPQEFFFLDPGFYEARIQKVQTTGDHGLRLCAWIEDGDGVFIPITRIYPQYCSPARSLSTPADAQGAFAVGAWNSEDTQVARYSSRGPTADGRLKPDLLAPSGLSTLGYAPETFEGTSASTPVCAGAAALLVGAYPELGPNDLEAILKVNARDEGTSGPDTTAGWGFLNLPPVPPLELFGRGDMDGSGKVELTDSIFLLNYLFLGGQTPPCLDAADADDNGELQITDAVLVLTYLYQGGDAPAEPSSGCGNDATEDSLGCGSSTCP